MEEPSREIMDSSTTTTTTTPRRAKLSQMPSRARVASKQQLGARGGDTIPINGFRNNLEATGLLQGGDGFACENLTRQFTGIGPGSVRSIDQIRDADSRPRTLRNPFQWGKPPRECAFPVSVAHRLSRSPGQPRNERCSRADDGIQLSLSPANRKNYFFLPKSQFATELQLLAIQSCATREMQSQRLTLGPVFLTTQESSGSRRFPGVTP